MKKQQGFAVVEAILILVVVGIIGFTGWFVWNSSNKADDTLSKSNNSQNPEYVKNNETKESDTIAIVVFDEPYSVVDVDDVNKLPNSVPSSFKTYLRQETRINAQESEDGCIAVYKIEKTSPLNVSGSVSDQSKPDAKCEGGAGAAMLWYLKNNVWKSLALQDAPSCDFLEKTTLYVEFVEKCTQGEEYIANPNGSIEDALAEN